MEKKRIIDVLKGRDQDLEIFHLPGFVAPQGVIVHQVECHNEARKRAYKLLKKYGLKCQTLHNQPDIVSGHALIYRENGEYSAIIIDKEKPFLKKEIQTVRGVRFLPLHWTERSSVEQKKVTKKHQLRELTEARFRM